MLTRCRGHLLAQFYKSGVTSLSRQALLGALQVMVSIPMKPSLEGSDYQRNLEDQPLVAEGTLVFPFREKTSM